MATLPDPQSTRREGIPARSFTLSDSQEWGFALPSRLIRPRIDVHHDALGRRVNQIQVEVGFGYPVYIRRLIESLREASLGDSVPLQYEAFLALAAALLMRAHDIDLSTAFYLLTISEEDFPFLIRHVLTVISLNDLEKSVVNPGGSSE